MSVVTTSTQPVSYKAGSGGRFKSLEGVEETVTTADEYQKGVVTDVDKTRITSLKLALASGRTLELKADAAGQVTLTTDGKTTGLGKGDLSTFERKRFLHHPAAVVQVQVEGTRMQIDSTGAIDIRSRLSYPCSFEEGTFRLRPGHRPEFAYQYYTGAYPDVSSATLLSDGRLQGTVPRHNHMSLVVTPPVPLELLD